MPGIIVVEPLTDFLPICTDVQAKEYLKLEQALSDTEKSYLTRMIDAATNWLEAILNRKIKTRAYSGSVDGNGLTYLYPRDDGGRPLCPITTLTSLVIDDVSVAAGDADKCLLYGTSGYIRLVDGSVFTKGFQNVDLVLVAGFVTIPPLLVQAACELVAGYWRSRDKQEQDVQSISEMGTTVTFRLDMLKKETREAIMLYRKLAV